MVWMTEAAILKWDPVVSAELKDYRIFYGQAPGRYTKIINVGTETELPLTDLQPGATYYFAVTLRTVDGGESGYSQEVRYKVPIPQTTTNPPTGHAIPFLRVLGGTNLVEDRAYDLLLEFSDADTPISNLLVFAIAPKGSTFGPSPILSSGLGSSRTLHLLPSKKSSGYAELTLYVTDGTSTNSSTIHFNILPVDDTPTIDAIPNLKRTSGQTFGPIPLTIRDADTRFQSLRVWAFCTDSNWLSSDRLRIHGFPGNNASLEITPPPGTLGSGIIRVGVTDGASTNWAQFEITIDPKNLPPSIEMHSSEWGYARSNIHISARVRDDGLPLAPGALTYGWTQVSGPTEALISSTNSLSVTVLFRDPGDYLFRFAASDGDLTTERDCIVNVRAQMPEDAEQQEVRQRQKAPPLPQILNFNVISVSDTALSLSWETDTDADSRIECAVKGIFQTSQTAASGPWTTRHSVNLEHLAPGTMHTFRTWARNLAGGEMHSYTLSVCTLNKSILYQPLPMTQARLTQPLRVGFDDEGMWGVSASDDVSPGSGEAAVYFEAVQAGQYALWARVRPGPGVAFPRIATFDNLDLTFGTAATSLNGTGWGWVALRPVTGDDNPLPIKLELGQHAVGMAGFPRGAILSDLILTTDPDYVPEDITPVAGLLSPAGLDTPVLVRFLPQGWSLVANPFSSPLALPGFSIPGAVAGTEIHQVLPRASDLQYLSLDEENWSGNITLDFQRAAFIFNPSPAWLPLLLTGTESSTHDPIDLPTRTKIIFTPARLRGGLLSDLMDGFVFKPGDVIQSLDRQTGEMISNSYKAKGWEVVPTLSAGESIILKLAPR